MDNFSSPKYLGKPMSEIPRAEIGNATVVVRRRKENFRDVFTCKADNTPPNAIYMGMAIGGTAQGPNQESLLSLVCHLPG